MKTLGIILIIAILGSFISDLIASITVYIVESYQVYKQKKNYIRARKKGVKNYDKER